MLDRLVEALRKTFKSRFIPIVTIYILLFFVLIIRLFALQIVESDELVDKSIATDEKVRDIKSSRGNIYDCNGNILASNQLSYSVTIEDTGELTTNAAKNEAILKMIQIIKKNNDELNIDFYIELNKDNELIFTVDKSGELRFKRDAYFAKSIDDLTDEQKRSEERRVGKEC